MNMNAFLTAGTVENNKKKKKKYGKEYFYIMKNYLFSLHKDFQSKKHLFWLTVPNYY